MVPGCSRVHTADMNNVLNGYMNQQGQLPDLAPPDRSRVLRTRRLFWLYCIMWLLEGSLRKWVFPGLAEELLLVRDPLVILLYLVALSEGCFPRNGWLSTLGVYCLVFFAIGTAQVSLGQVPWDIALFGYRTLFLHLPLIWIVPEILDASDLRRLGVAVLLLAPFLAALMIVQFMAPSEAWINAGAGIGATQIGSTGGHIRPAALFSFISGPVHYFALCAAFTLAGFLDPKLFPRPLLVAATGATLVAMAVSGSRSLVLGCVVVAVAGVLASTTRSANILRGAFFICVIVVVYHFVGQVSVLQEGQTVFAERWAGGEGGDVGGSAIVNRYFRTFSRGFYFATIVPPFGNGLGITSNLAVLVYKKQVPVETEWERIIYEVGACGGFPYLAYRLFLAMSLVVAGARALGRGESLPILLCAACGADIVTGNFRQPTSLGFVCVCAGLTLAAARQALPQSVAEAAPRVTEAFGPRIHRGRGIFAVGDAGET